MFPIVCREEVDVYPPTDEQGSYHWGRRSKSGLAEAKAVHSVEQDVGLGAEGAGLPR